MASQSVSDNEKDLLLNKSTATANTSSILDKTDQSVEYNKESDKDVENEEIPS